MMADHLINDKAQEFLAEIGVKIGVACQRTQTGDLLHLALGIGRGQAVLGLMAANGLGDLEAFGEQEHERGVNIVDALAIAAQCFVRQDLSPFCDLMPFLGG